MSDGLFPDVGSPSGMAGDDALNFIQLDEHDPRSISIVFDGKTLVTIHADGTLTYGEDYEPDKAARIFWEALGKGRNA